jgi:Protein of unknown function (DUF3179)
LPEPEKPHLESEFMWSIETLTQILTQTLHWAALTLCLWPSYLVFRDLADISQFWLETERKVVMNTWYRRHLYLFLSALGAALAIYTHLEFGAGYLYVTAAVIGITIIHILGGYFNPGWMMRSAQHNSTFVPVKEAENFIPKDYEVLVIEKDGIARAHTDYELWRPHIVGNEDGLNGENVVMTYCALTNLGMAYKPEIEGKPVNLKVMSQMENNLVMWDTHSGEPIQQIWGKHECSGEQGTAMPQHPVFKMPFCQFAKAYPDGQVFKRQRALMKENPVLALYDKFWEALFYMAIHRQKQEAAPVFPTLKKHDDSLHPKLPVWGFNIGNDYVCYSTDFVRKQGNLINVVVGGQHIVVHWSEEYQCLGIWYSDQAVSEIDFFGQSNLGQLQRVETVKAGCFYAMWYNFFPQTEVNRL